jgi:hypothetical protein
LKGQAVTYTSSATTLVITNAIITNSVLKALSELGVSYNVLNITGDTLDLTTIDYTPYGNIVFAPNGGILTAGSMVAVANAVKSGKSLMLFGGSGLQDYAKQVNDNLFQVSLNSFWGLTVAPNLNVTNSGHFLVKDIPSSVTFANSWATVYMLRMIDAEATTVARDGDNLPVLFEKTIGKGRVMCFVNIADSIAWTDGGDYSILKTIIRNMMKNASGIYQ